MRNTVAHPATSAPRSAIAGGRGQVAAVRHAVWLLTQLANAEQPLAVTELSRLSGLHKATVSRLLATLDEARLVERDVPGGRYRLGAGIVALAGPLLARLDVRDVALPVLQRLALDTGQSVSLSIWSRGEAVNVDHVLGPGTIKHIAPVGRRSPGHASANGKVFVAFGPAEALDEVVERGLPRFTDRTLCDEASLRAELERVRQVGYAVNDRELDDQLVAVSAPVFDRTGRLVAALGVSAPAFDDIRARLSDFGSLTGAAAEEVSTRLGYRASARRTEELAG